MGNWELVLGVQGPGEWLGKLHTTHHQKPPFHEPELCPLPPAQVLPSLRGFLLKAQKVAMEIFIVCFQKPNAYICFNRSAMPLGVFRRSCLVAPNDGVARSGLCCLGGTHQTSSSILLVVDPDNPGLGPWLGRSPGPPSLPPHVSDSISSPGR